MDLSDRVELADWVNDRWDDVDDSITVRTALGSGYGHARSTKDAIYGKVIPMLEQLTSPDETTAARLDTAALSSRLSASLTDALGHRFADLDGDDLAEAVDAAVTKAVDSLAA